MDLTLTLRNVAPGDYMHDNIGSLVVDGRFYCNTVTWGQPAFPVRVRKQTLASGDSFIGLAPGPGINAHYCACFVVEGNEAHWLDCERVTFKYASFASGGRPQASYVNNSDKISWDVFELDASQLGVVLTYSFVPQAGQKIRRAILAGDGTVFDEITFHNVERSSMLAQPPAGDIPVWLKQR